MPMFKNGYVPYDVVSVVLASGTDRNGYWEYRCTPSSAARWAFAKQEAERRFGRTIHIRTGWNLYRPIEPQKTARKNACASGNCNGASVAGYSSHGGNWQGRDCLAVDVDPNGLTWDQVDQAMEAAGFSARMITEAMSGIRGGERWHYIDFNAFGPVPAGMDATPFEEDDMNGQELQGDFAYNIRPKGFGADAKFGPTIWERLADSISVAGQARDAAKAAQSTLFDLRVQGRNVFDWFIQSAADRAAFDAKDAARDAALLEAIKALAAGAGLDPERLAVSVRDAAKAGAEAALSGADFPTGENIAAAVLSAQERARLADLEAQVSRLQGELG